MQDQNLRKITRMALVASVVLVATMFLKVPVTPGGYIHLGDGVIYAAALAFGPTFAAISGAIGSSLADVLGGYAMWWPWTLVIKGVAGWVIGKIGYNQGRSRQLLAMVVAAAWTVAGYAVGTSVMFSPSTALAESLGNVIQTGSGIVIGLFLAPVLKVALAVDRP
jgi:uncharacterized membrane protein